MDECEIKSIKQIMVLVSLLLATILFVSCNKSLDNRLYGKWRLEKYNCIFLSSYNLIQVDGNSDYCLQLNNTGNFSCTTDCNSISGKFDTDKTRLTFGDLARDGIVCENMIVERSIETTLSGVYSYEIKNDTILLLKDKHQHILLELKKIE